VNEGSFLQSFNTFWDNSGFNNYTSLIEPVSCIKEYNNTGVTGSGLLATISFEAINSGQTMIYFSNIILVNSDGNQISVNYQNKVIEILQNSVSLYNASVTPPQGTTDDNFEFSVFYKYYSNNAPNSVTVNGTSWNYIMNANGTNWEDGVEFTKTLTFPTPGIVEYYFEAETNNSEIIRYPETGYLQLNVTQSAVGWNILVSDLIADPTYMTSGGNVDCQGEIYNNCSNTYTNLQYKFEMFNPNGNLIDEESGTISSINPWQTVSVSKTLTTQNTNGLYNNGLYNSVSY